MDEEDYDIYGDLDGALTEPLEEDKIRQQEADKARIEDEKRSRQEIEENIAKLREENNQLKKNMSALLVTAKGEIERKDQQIKQLRKELDDLIFRKTNVSKLSHVTKRDICTQTISTQAYCDKYKESTEYSRDPIDRLKIKKDQNDTWKSRERNKSRERDYRNTNDRRRQTPTKQTTERLIKKYDETIRHKKRHESPKKRRSPDRTRISESSKQKSRHEGPEIFHKKRSSSRDRNSSKEKDSSHDRDRGKSPSRRERKGNDLRSKILEKRNLDTKTKINDDKVAVKSETKLKTELTNKDCKSEKHSIKEESSIDDLKITEQKCDQNTKTVEHKAVEQQRKSTRNNHNDAQSLKKSGEKSTEIKREIKERDQKSCESSKNKNEGIKTKKQHETPKKSKNNKKSDIKGINSPELIKILKSSPKSDTIKKDQEVSTEENSEASKAIKGEPKTQSTLTSEGNLSSILESWAITEKIQNSPNDAKLKNIIASNDQVEVEVFEYSSEIIALGTNVMLKDGEKDITMKPSMTPQEVSNVKVLANEFTPKQAQSIQTPKLCFVPMEIGPQYKYNDHNEEAKSILELPVNNEEVIFDSRSLSAEEIPVKSPENESFDSTKENSSLNTSGKSKKRKIVTTEVEDDGTVVFTITRKKKRKTTKS